STRLRSTKARRAIREPDMQRLSFQARALLGYCVVMVGWAGGMTLSVHRFATAVVGPSGQLRAAQQQITRHEPRGWHGVGLLSAEPALLAELERSAAEFDQDIDKLYAQGGPFIDEVEQAASDFRREQAELSSARQGSEDTQSLVDRFETELLPMRHELDKAL